MTLKIYDVLGNEAATLIEEKQGEGSYEAAFDATNFPSGVYFYKLVVSNTNTLTSNNLSITKKNVINKIINK